MSFDDNDNFHKPSQNDDTPPDTSPEACLRLGDANIARGKIEQALERYRKAVKLGKADPESSETRSTLGDAYVYADQTVNALRQYRRAVRTSPRRAAPHFSLAELYRRYGKTQIAMIEYRRAIECDTQNAFIITSWATALQNRAISPRRSASLKWRSSSPLPTDSIISG
jgi:Tfp pilus assembly protein PilF